MGTLKAQFTAYTSSRSAKTADGTNPSETTCAAPPEIAFGTKIKVQGTGTKQDGKVYTVTDRGGLVKLTGGRYIFDLWMPTEAECKKFGRRNGTAEIVTKKKDFARAGTANIGKKDASSAGKKELNYLKKVLNRKQETMDVVSGEITQKKTSLDVRVQVIVQNGKEKFVLPVLDEIKIAYERSCVPGKLTFQTPEESKFKFREGNRVLLRVNNQDAFAGFVFTRSREESGIISVTCYDQLRYLKNKTTMVYKNKTAAELLVMIANDFLLTCGSIADTKHKIKKKIEDDITLFDIIQNALDETLLSTGELFVLYDECGKLMLKNSSDMINNQCVVNEETAQSCQYTSTIDEDVYNQIKLVYENTKNGTYDVYMAKDSSNISKWGVLQYTEKIDTPDVGKLKADALLQYYNQLKRTLSVQGVLGDISLRAGSMIPVFLNLGDVKVQNYMMVEQVTHEFSNRQHTMDIALSGGKFSG